jgi:hypothetical protein
MEIPSVNDMIEALNSPIAPPEDLEKVECEEDQEENYILLDLLKAITRVETKLDVLLDSKSPKAEDPAILVPDLFSSLGPF